ncbi:M23 family metallopeptidase [Streptomyces sp. NPDC005438]|uniref:M23 family metallopeptidase n=1 Tax=Streptomyces sp. NPDC005438 TaxID=3156880 RepID=UPI0033B79BEA
MASNRYAPEAGYGPAGPSAHLPYDPYGMEESDPHGSPDPAPYQAYGPRIETDEPEWNPTAESVRPVRGRHRVVRQRGGMARSGAVLGVGMIAAVGAGGMATAQDKSPTAVTMPDLGSTVDKVSAELPAAKELPGVGELLADDGADRTVNAAPLTQAGLTQDDSRNGQTNAGEALRHRILAQAEQQRGQAEQAAADEAASEAARQAAAKAAEDAEKERKAEAEKKRKAAEEKKRKAEEKRRAELAKQYTVPLSSYQLTSGFGDSGGMWQSNHTGQDFAAPTGTPVKAVHSGTIKEAGWAGSYGYRIVLELDDGTEIWFCHLSSMSRTSGKVTTGDVIGRVGSTGNSSGPHLHVEVRPGGGDAIDPLAWLRGKGQQV